MGSGKRPWKDGVPTRGPGDSGTREADARTGPAVWLIPHPLPRGGGTRMPRQGPMSPAGRLS
ncbi:hypothetical protein GCM10010331_14700 [Streptomyces xanthochromogenes]|nr:hypothetical protein GCM10010331_14700 [Streptomyces xanthochromogenes]